jgi:hypothetical protein
MSERSVSDLIFRDFEPQPHAGLPDREREATLREELEKLRAPDNGPRVIPASRQASPAGEPSH